MRVSRILVLTLAVAAAALAQAPAAKPAPKPAVKAAPAKPAAQKTLPGGVVGSYKDLKYGALNNIQVPEPARFELPNGMVVYLIEDHETPTITVSAMIRGGSRWEPRDKAGLAAITGAVMRTGGTKTRNGDALDEELDRLGATVETGMMEDSGRAMIGVLKEDIDRALEILADLVENPAFPEDKIELAKIQQRDGIARRNENPMGIAQREFRRIIYGKDSPYGRTTEYDTINSIARADLVAFHQQFFQPENVILAAWGDFNAAEMRAKIERTLGAWKRGGKPKPPIPEVEAAAKNRTGLYFIPKDDVNQSTVLLGYLIGQRNDPDYFALSVMNDILGGGISSRTFRHIRSEQGLSYFANTSWAAGWDRPGIFIGSGATKSENTVKIISSFKKELADIATGDITDDELARAKDSILKGFAFEFDSTAKVISRLMMYEYYGYPKDYLQQYKAQIEKVTKADVARVAKQYIDPGKLAILVLGKEKDFVTPLGTLGKYATVDISIPAPKQKALAAATPDSIKKGKALLASLRQGMGGDAIAAVKDTLTSLDASVEMPQGAFSMKMSVASALTGKLVQKVSTPMGEMMTVWDGNAGWMKTGANVRDLPLTQKPEMDAALFRDTLHLLQNLDDPAYTVQALGAEQVNGKDVEAVAVSDAARKLQVKLYIDPETKLLAKKVYTASIMGPPSEIEETYSDYRDVNGVKFPFASELVRAGKRFMSMKVSEVKVNAGIDEASLKKPQ